MSEDQQAQEATQETQQEETVSKADFDKLKANHEIVKRKLSKATANRLKPQDLLKDPEFRKKAFQSWEIPHDEEGNFKLPENLKDQGAIEDEFKERLKSHREQWAKKELEPFKEQLSAFEQENGSLKNDVLIAALERSAKKIGVLDTKFKPFEFGDGKTAPVHMARDRFKYSKEHGQHVLMDGEDLAYSDTGDPIFADNFFKHFFDGADEAVRREWLGDQRQRGSGFMSNGKPTGRFVMSREEAAKSPQAYRAKKKAAAAAGQVLKLTD